MSEAYKIDWKEELIDGKVAAMSPAANNHNVMLEIYLEYLNFI